MLEDDLQLSRMSNHSVLCHLPPPAHIPAKTRRQGNQVSTHARVLCQTSGTPGPSSSVALALHWASELKPQTLRQHSQGFRRLSVRPGPQSCLTAAQVIQSLPVTERETGVPESQAGSWDQGPVVWS